MCFSIYMHVWCGCRWILIYECIIMFSYACSRLHFQRFVFLFVFVFVFVLFFLFCFFWSFWHWTSLFIPFFFILIYINAIHCADICIHYQRVWTRTCTYIDIYIYVCVCVFVCIHKLVKTYFQGRWIVLIWVRIHLFSYRNVFSS